MRMRTVKPEYWTDALLHTQVPADVREFYIGLWMQSDDAGYVAWDIDRIGAELYPYQSLEWRRQHLVEWLNILRTLDKRDPLVVMLRCKKHLHLPTLTRHQRASRPVRTVADAHARTCGHVGARASTVPHASKVREGKVRESNSARARDGARGAESDDDDSEFRRRVPRPD